MDDYRECAEECLRFIEECPSKYHVIEKLACEYGEQGFIRLDEKEEWKLKWGKNYVVTRNGSALIAFRLPKKKEAVKGFHMAAAHCDSPTFQVKENPERKAEQYVLVNTEKYGGMIYSTWLDRPLSVAGRIAVRDEKSGEIKAMLVNVDRDLLVIPNLAIHMNREINKGMEYNPQVDLQPLFCVQTRCEGLAGTVTRAEQCGRPRGAEVTAQCEGQSEAAARVQGDEDWSEAAARTHCSGKNGLPHTLMELVAEAAGVEASDILGRDLFLYVRDKGRMIGAREEMILSPRLDDLQCVYALTKAHEEEKTGEYVTLCAVFDNEEVGSGSVQGADSTFLEDVLIRMAEALDISQGKLRAWIANGFMVSADNAHAVHPNHPEKADPTNRPYLNGGIVIKFNSAQKYTSDGMTAAYFRDVCEKAGVPCQTYVNRSDVAGGSTLGNISTAHVSIPSVDIGLPQLAMHSAVETAGTEDTWYAYRAMREYFGR